MVKAPTISASFKIILMTFVALIASLSSYSQCWNQVWSDEFDGSSLDGTKWSYDLGNGCPGLCNWGNNEKEYYTNNSNNISVSGGYLNITAKYDPNYNGSGSDFTSAKIHTRDKYYPRYGKVEASIKLPAGTGMWPAFWMLPQSPSQGWPTSGEIDIMENRGDNTTRIGGTLHYGNASPNNQWDGTDYDLTSGDFTSSFHLFAVEWEQGEIRWYVDGVLFKTETETPNSLNPASNNAEDWPWNNDFYIILNLAVGGWYTGNPSTGAITGGDVNFSRSMQVDYVRVYEDLSGGGFSGNITGKSSVLMNETGVTYTIPSTATATYDWSVTGSGSLATADGSSTIDIDWGTTDGTVNVDKTLSCGTASYSLPVTVQPTPCGEILEDFENIRYSTYGYINGVFTQKVANPSPSAENTSPYCAKYIRNSSEQYDVLILDGLNLDNVDDFEKKIKTFLMDVYSDGSGRTISIGLENSSVATSGNYPTGRHSSYTATTSAVNSWETLKFQYQSSPDPGLSGTSVDRLVIMFESGSYTSHTFYFDNLIASFFPSTGSITGSASVCENQTGVTYSVTNTSGSTYAWTVPSGALITSGSTGPDNNSITVTFGTTSGNVTVTETNTAGCTGNTKTLAVTVNALPSTGSITGTSPVCGKESGVSYSVINTSGSTYAWTVPSGAVITSGSTGPNNNSIAVTFGTSSGNVSVTETNAAGCAGSSQMFPVTMKTYPATTAITGVSSVCNNDAGITYSIANTSGSTYTWSVPSGALITSGSTGPDNNSITVTFGTTSGSVAVTETNTAGCAGDQKSLAVSVSNCSATSVKNASFQNLVLYPNPSDNSIFIESLPTAGVGNIIITDCRGEVVRSMDMDMGTGASEINVADLSQGVYHLRILKDGKSFSGIFTKF